MEECVSPYKQYKEVKAVIVIPRDKYCHRTHKTHGLSATCEFFLFIKGGECQGYPDDYAVCTLLSIEGIPTRVPNEELPFSEFNFVKPKECLNLKVVQEKD